MTTDVKLLPCPFCCAPAERIDFGPGDAENEGGSCIACTQCQSSGPVEFGRKENFVSNWNHRAPNPLIAENERLRGEVRKVCADHKQVCCDYEGLRDILGSKLIKAEARAERLAEALREAADDLERGIDARIVVAQLRAALDQEGGK